MKITKTFDYSFTQIFLFASYLISWLSISTSIEDVLNFSKEMSLSEFINFARQLFNLLIFPVLLLFFFKEFKFINFRNEILLISLMIYFLFQLPGILLTENSYYNLGYIISALNILLIFILSNIYISKKEYFNFFYITLIILSMISILNYKTFVNFFTSESHNVLYTFFNSNELFAGKTSPRSTGSSRTFLLIYLIINLIFFRFLKKYQIVKIICYIFTASVILLFQSRTTSTLLLIFVLLNFFNEQKFSFKDYINYFIIYFLTPVIFILSLVMIKENLNNKNILNELPIEKNLQVEKILRPFDQQTFSSGRFNDWKKIISKMNNSLIYGFGAQGDRFLIQQSASNALIYSLSSSGILGLIFFSIFSINCLFILINLIKIKIIKLNDIFICAVIVILFLLRSLLESSYAVFSIDYIILLTSINYLNRFKQVIAK